MAEFTPGPWRMDGCGMDGATNCAMIPLDDLEALQAALDKVEKT